MSLGSIIDVNLIDGKSEYVILQPTDFIRCLDKVFNPKMFIPGVAMCGIVTKSIANYIFNADHEFFMNVLVSVDLALELNSNQIVIGSQFAREEENQKYYFLPDVRTIDPNLECHPTTLRLLYNTNGPLLHLQILFARALLEKKPFSKLVFTEKSPINITTFRVISSRTQEAVDFEMRYLGEAVEFRVRPEADEDICSTIIQSCHKMMENKWGGEQYNFAVTCSIVDTPYRLRQKHHLLPNETLCETCMKQDGLREMLSIWNSTLKMVSSLNGIYLVWYCVSQLR